MLFPKMKEKEIKLADRPVHVRCRLFVSKMAKATNARMMRRVTYTARST
jgi:hypothetical protein